jgi:hypothetical protein
MLRVRLLSGALAVVGLLATGASRADTLPADALQMTFSAGGMDWTIDQLPVVYSPGTKENPGEGGTWTIDNLTVPGLLTITDWTSEADADPFVTNNLTVTNISGVVQTFDVIVTSPVVPTGPQTLMTGSLTVGITNTASGGVTLTDAAAPVYQAYIDGVVQQTLLNPAYSLSCAPPFCSNSQFPSPGFVNVLGPGAATNIAIRIRFTLTPGDSAAITSVFNIDAVPEPVTAAMLGLGLVGLAIAGSRLRG